MNPDPISREIERLTKLLVLNGLKVSPAAPGAPSSEDGPIHYSRFGHPRTDYSTREWEALRTRHLQRHARCENCSRVKVLQLHHRCYYSGRKAWEYADSDLVVLCKACHSLVHDKMPGAIEYLEFERTVERMSDASRRRAWDDYARAEAELEIAVAMGESLDPADDYDPDNPADYDDEFGRDPQDEAEAELERLYGEDYDDEDDRDQDDDHY